LQQQKATILAQAKDNTIAKDQEILGKDNEIAKLREALSDVTIKYNRKCDAFKNLKKNHLQDLKEAKQCRALPKASPMPEAVELRTENFALQEANAVATTESDTLRTRLGVAEQQRDYANELLQSSKARVDEEVRDLATQHGAAVAAKDDLIGSLTKQNATIVDQRCAAVAANDALQHKNTKLAQERDDAVAASDDLGLEVAELTEQCDTVKEGAECLVDEMVDAHAEEVAELQRVHRAAVAVEAERALRVALQGIKSGGMPPARCSPSLKRRRHDGSDDEDDEESSNDGSWAGSDMTSDEVEDCYKRSRVAQ
jgi:hypothetical protein